MIMGIQIIGVIFGLIMGYFVFLHYKRKEFNKFQFLLWEFIWFGFIIVILFPRITGSFIHQLGITRSMDLLTILGFMFLTILTFFNYTVLNKLKRKLEENVREESLKNLK